MIERVRQILVGVYGAFLGVTLVKFGNPVILDHLIQAPSSGWELLYGAWPSRWVFDIFFGSYFVVGLLFILTAVAAFKNSFSLTYRELRCQKLVMLILGCLGSWYVWQWVAALDTVNQSLTRATLSQFTMCLFCFLFGFFCLKTVDRPSGFLLGLLAGLVIVLWAGLDQRFGGLEATRRMIYEQGGLDSYPEELLQRISKGRVFGTMFYPNTLAGAILILAPITITFVYRATIRFGNVAWGLAVGLLGYLLVGCLYWSGSKSGWLIAAAMLLAIVLRMPLPKSRKWLVLGVVGVVALGAFGVRFAGYFQQGATSVVARFDYWRAGMQVAAENPFTGSGPGTFEVPYARLKAPESEMARLAHNDYLQQASDSGFPGFFAYCGFLFGSIALLYRKSHADFFRFAIWLGLAAWALHSFVEFGLYIPAIAWPAFTFLGWQLGNGMDTAAARN